MKKVNREIKIQGHEKFMTDVSYSKKRIDLSSRIKKERRKIRRKEVLIYV